MAQAERRKCVHCGASFTPEARNQRHQRYCTGAPCRIASKRASQAKWLAKPENQDYHRGPEAVESNEKGSDPFSSLFYF